MTSLVGSELAQGKAATRVGPTPESSPDLNPLENLKEIIQPCTSVQQLAERLKSVWVNVLWATLKRLVSGTPKLVSECGALCGEHIGVWCNKNSDLCCFLLTYDRCKRTFQTPCTWAEARSATASFNWRLHLSIQTDDKRLSPPTMSYRRVLATTSSTGSRNGGLGSYRSDPASVAKARRATAHLLTERLVVEPVEDVAAMTRRQLIADRESLYHQFLYLNGVGSQNLPVADLSLAHVVSTVTLPNIH